MHLVEAFIGQEIGISFAAGALAVPLSIHVIRVGGGLSLPSYLAGIISPR